MQEKLTELLSSATGWMTANELAEKGGWRNPAHVGLALKQMPDVEHRTSPTKKMGNGMPAKEYKLKDKDFSDSNTPDRTVPVVAPSTKSSKISSKLPDMPTCTKSQTESKIKQPDPVFTQPAHDNEMAGLRAKLALAEKQCDDYFKHAESLQKALEYSDSKLGLLGTMLINIEGDGIEDKLGKVLHDHQHATQRISDLEDDVRRHSERSSDGERANGAWLSLAAEYECKSVPDLRVFIESLERRVDVLKMAVESMHEQLDAKHGNTSFDVSSATQYIVKTPSRPPRFTKLHKNAHSVAMSSARQHGFAEVFALVPVGKAVRGAEWRPK